MNPSASFDNQLAAFVGHLHQTTPLLTEVAVLSAAAILAWLGVRALRGRIGETQLMHLAYWNRIVLPVLMLPMILVARTVLVQHQAVHLLNLAMPLVLSFVVVQTTFTMLRRILKPSPVLQALERSVSWLVWGGVALYLTGWLDDVNAALDAIGFNIGRQHISLYTVFMGLLSLAGSLALALWLGRVIEGRLLQMPVNANMRLALTKLARSLLVLLAVLVALPLVGIDITVLSVFGGALGVGLGLGLQKIAANYVSGFTLLLDQSIRLGDMVTVDKYHGEVKKIATRYTVIRALNGTECIVPNDTMITSIVVNDSLTDRDNRIFLPVQVAYATDLRRVEAVLLKIATDHPRVLNQPPARVMLRQFGESGIDLDLAVWIADPQEGEAALRSDLNWAIWEAFQRDAIEIPYPHRVVRLVPEASRPLAVK